ncbi:MAG: helix-turn-helix domain-containing protein [Mycobacteriales bacterium]
MSSPELEVPRRQLSGRRPEMVARLLDAAVAEVTATGFDQLTVRKVAKAAGVSAATAYAYFASKEHLLAEVFWRRLQLLAPLDLDGTIPLGARVEAAVGPIALAVADEPELAAGVTTALLAHDPDVKALRDLIGGFMAERLAAALGPDVPEQAQLAFTLMLIGALLSSGMAIIDYHALPGILGGFADLVAERSGEGKA